MQILLRLSTFALNFDTIDYGRLEKKPRCVSRSPTKQDPASSKNWIMFYVYALSSRKNNDLYIGYSQDLRKRVDEHNSGLVKATKGYRPWVLIYYEAYISKLDATKREVQLKKNHRSKEDLTIQISNSLES